MYPPNVILSEIISLWPQLLVFFVVSLYVQFFHKLIHAFFFYFYTDCSLIIKLHIISFTLKIQAYRPHKEKHDPIFMIIWPWSRSFSRRSLNFSEFQTLLSFLAILTAPLFGILSIYLLSFLFPKFWNIYLTLIILELSDYLPHRSTGKLLLRFLHLNLSSTFVAIISALWTLFFCLYLWSYTRARMLVK